MDTKQTNWRRTTLTVVVLAALVFAPFVFAKASHANWDLGNVANRMPWHSPALAGEITTDQAAAEVCASTPTFDLTEDDAGVRLHLGGPLTLGQTNDRLADLGVPLEVGLRPTDLIDVQPMVSSISQEPGDPALGTALNRAVGANGLLLSPITLPAQGAESGLVITCPGVDAG